MDRAAEAVLAASADSCRWTRQNQANPCPASIFCVTIFIIRIIVLVLRRLLLIPFQPRRPRRALLLGLAFSFFLMSLPAWAAEKTRLRVDDYQIDAELTPHSHKITAQAKVKFTALDDLNIATFELHNALRVTKVIDATSKPLSAERVTQDSTVRVPLTTPVCQRQLRTTLTFEYEGVLDSADDSPVQGLKLAYIGDDTSYLLYAGRWFPVNAYGINRFTATMNITVPAHMIVIGSGKESCPAAAPATKRPAGALPTKTFTFTWDKPSFPGTIVAGIFQEFKSDEAGLDLHVFFKPAHQSLGAAYATTAVKEFTYYVTLYGPAPSTTLRVVEIPDDTVPAAWAPEIAAIASRAVTEKVNYRLLANTIAHQWWGASVSPASQGRLVAERRLRALLRGALRRAGRRSGGTRRSGERYVGRGAGLRHRAAFERGQARRLLARIPVAGDRQGRHDPAHAALGDRRPEIRPDHAHFRRQVCGKVGVARRFPRPRRTELRPASSPGSSPSGSTPPARPSSRPSTPSTAWATTRASAWWVRSRRTSTFSACRWT